MLCTIADGPLIRRRGSDCLQEFGRYGSPRVQDRHDDIVGKPSASDQPGKY